MDTNLWEKEFLTQQEVASYFRVVPATIKNWRDQGLLSYWQAPGSSRVLYFSNGVKEFRDKNTFNKKGGDVERKTIKVKRETPDISSTPNRKWEI